MRQENVAALAGDRTVSDNRSAMAASPHLSVRVLGPARVTVDGAAAPPELLWRKHLALLVYLARSPRKSRTREHLLGLLWSDRTEPLARHSLSEALRVLRRVLGDTAVQADVDQVRLATDRVTLDCDRFAAHAERGEWDSAAALVEGEFLEGLALPDANQFETWLGAERTLWRAQGLEALVKSAEAQLARGDTPAARPRPPLLGRSAELAAAAAAWERAKAARGQVVLVQGEPGEGKTRLIEELVARARLDDATVAAARAVPADREREWSAVAGLVAAGLADAPGLASAPAPALASLGALDPDLGTRFRGGRAEPAMHIGQAFTAAVTAAAQERPLLLVIDDAQWLDALSLALLPALARDTAPHRVLLLLGVARGGPDGERCDVLQGRLGRDLEGAVIRLDRLDQTALAELVAWAVPAFSADERDRLGRRVERDTAGIPLLAVALVEAVAAGYRLAPDAPAWPTPARTLIDSLPGTLPPAVVGAVCLRFGGLPLAAQHVLGAAAALGGRADVTQLARATGLEPGPVAQALDVLEWERWLSADMQGYVFAAPIERDIVLQEMLTPGQARRYREQSVA